jgi:hypothetical protein
MAARPGHRREEQRLDANYFRARSPRSGPTAPSPGYTNCRTGHCHGRRPSMGPAASGWQASASPTCGSSAALTPPRARPAHRPAPYCRPRCTWPPRPPPPRPPPPAPPPQLPPLAPARPLTRRAGSGP